MRFLFLAYRDAKNPAAVGGDYYLSELAKNLRRVGNEVTFVCSSFEGSRAREVVDGVEVVRLKGNGGLPFLVFKEYMRHRRGIYDIVLEEAIGGQRLPFFASLYVGEPLVAVWYQRHYRIFREQYPFPIWGFAALLELFLARLYRNHTILTLSKGAKRELMRLGFRSGRVMIIYVGGTGFERATVTRVRDDSLVCLGKLRRYKRYDHALLALARVRSRVGRPIKLIIAGKVSETDRGYVGFLQQLAEQLGLMDSVEFRLNISEAEKMELLEKARVLVIPSPIEGFSIVTTEANSCGTPVVGSDGLPSDVLVNGQNGFVYPYGDIEALARVVLDLLNNDELWSKMSRTAKEMSLRFHWEESAAQLLKIAKSIVPGQGES